MTRAALASVLVATVVAALIGTLLTWPAALAVGAVVGVVTVALVRAGIDRDLDRVADSVSRWVGGGHDAAPVPTGAGWSRFAVVLHALGAAHARAADEIAEARAILEEVVDALPDPALLFGPDDHLVTANGAARSRFSLGRVERMTPTQAFTSGQLARAVEESRALHRAVEVEARIGARDLSALAVPIADEVLVIVRDRSEQRLVEAVRRDFVANASHELKTPVAGIQALADAVELTLDRDPSRTRSLVERLRQETERLSKTVHDLLDLRRLEEASPAEVVPVDLVEVIGEAIGRVAAAAEEQAVTIVCDVPESAVVAGVPQDLRLVVGNLLDNAVGYNRRGGRVDVSLRRAGGGWELAVRDTGVGIPQQDLDRVFERFYRVDVARSRATGGTGLGLAIVRHAVERHGGSVRVRSILGEGSTFTVYLPVGST